MKQNKGLLKRWAYMVNIKTQLVVNLSDLKYTWEAYYRQLDKILQRYHQINIESTSAIFKKNHHLENPKTFLPTHIKLLIKIIKISFCFLSAMHNVPGTVY